MFQYCLAYEIPFYKHKIHYYNFFSDIVMEELRNPIISLTLISICLFPLVN